MREIKGVVVHCSDSAWGNVAAIDEWHKARGWARVGYHWVIGNGHPDSRRVYDPAQDGVIEVGRPVTATGAHCVGANRTHLGVCLIGPDFTDTQIVAAARLVAELATRFGFGVEAVTGHREWPSGRAKQCPLIDMDDFRQQVAVELERGPTGCARGP